MDTLFKRNKKTLLGLITILIFLISTSCTSMIPMAGAMAGGGIGAIGGPATAALGAGVGLGTGELMKDGLEDDPTAQAVTQAVSALGTKEVQELINMAVGEQQGFFDGILSEVMNLIKLICLVTVLGFLVHFAYTWHRRKKGEAFYAEIERLKNKLKGD
tara:strand:+ start:3757 stop:4233 length:477 start_codon:yes stop_codon:yes gene_type:complete